MAIHRLTPLTIKQARQKRRYHDGGGLYLDVAAGGTKIWLFRWYRAGENHYISLGTLNSGVDVKQAREQAAELRKLVRSGGDPRVQRSVKRAELQTAAVKSKTFDDTLADYLAAKGETIGKSVKHRRQWESELRRHISPKIGTLPMAAIDKTHALAVLAALCRNQPVLARRLCQRLRLIRDYAKHHGYCSGDNPFTWSGNLEHVLPDLTKLAQDREQNFAALPYAEVPAYMAELRTIEDTVAYALRFLILTAPRAGSIVGGGQANKPPMLWSHVDLNERVWTIPSVKSAKTKAVSMRVPLSDAAIEVLQAMAARREDARVFPIGRDHMGRLLRKRFPAERASVHGFRASFRMWAEKETNFSKEVCEEALAHVTETDVQARYNRLDRCEKRAPLMQAWADYCKPAPGNVVPMRAA